MKTYTVRFWSEGPGRSHVETVLVLAKDRKSAIKLTIKECGVYKADQDEMTAKRFNCKNGMIIKHLEDEEGIL